MATTEMINQTLSPSSDESGLSTVGLAIGLAVISFSPGLIIVIIIVTIIVCVMTRRRSTRLTRTRDIGKC